MLEIVLIIFLAKKIGAKAELKGYKKGGYIFMFVAFWILGELIGAFAGVMVAGGEGLEVYLFALIGAGVGAGLSFFIMSTLAQKEPLVIPREDNSNNLK